jgi:hypothetical protein
LVLRDPAGEPVVAVAGDRLSATVDGVAQGLIVPALSGTLGIESAAAEASAAVDASAAARDAGGSDAADPNDAAGPADATDDAGLADDSARNGAAILVLRARSEPGARLRLARATPLGLEGIADAAGELLLPLDELSLLDEPRHSTWRGGGDAHEPVPNSLLQVVRELPGGHHARLRWMGLSAELHADGANPSGNGMPGERVTLVLGEGEAFETIVGPDERWQLGETLAGGEGLSPGAPVSAASAGWRLSITTPQLTIAQASGLLSGLGPPDEVLELRLRVPGAEVEESRTVYTGPDGSWRYDLRADLDLLRVPDQEPFDLRAAPLDRASIVYTDGPWTFRASAPLR